MKIKDFPIGLALFFFFVYIVIGVFVAVAYYTSFGLIFSFKPMILSVIFWPAKLLGVF